MRGFLIAGLALLTLTASSSISSADDTMQPGKWQITTEGATTIGGQKTELPKNQMESCVTPEQVKQTDVSKQPTADGCKSEVLSKSGGETKTRTTCPTSTTTTDFTLNSDSYTSVTHMEMKQGDTQVVTDMTATGKRVGDCAQ